MLVDDEELIHQLVRRSLHGYDVIAAFSARQALSSLAGREIDLVLLDINLPDASGLELVARIRAAHPTLPVVMFSSEFTADAVELAIRRGATGFLWKGPENIAALEGCVEAQMVAVAPRDVD